MRQAPGIVRSNNTSAKECLIPLSRGQFAIVSPERYEELSKYKWNAQWARHTQSYYAARSVRIAPDNWRLYTMHRQILGLPMGDKRVGDHINGVTLDNRDENLRVTDAANNAKNRRKNRNNKSGVTGVSFSNTHKRWIVTMRINGFPRAKYFKDKLEAVAARRKHEQEFLGEYLRCE